MATDLLASMGRFGRRVADRLAMLRYIRRNEGWGTALLALRRQLGQSLKHRLRTITEGGAGPYVAYPPAPMPADPAVLSAPPKTGVLFIGYVEASLGLGESLRGLVKAACRTRLPFAVHPYNFNVENRRLGPFHAERYDLENRFLVNVMEMSADQLPPLIDYLGPWRVKDSYNVLRTYWELPVAPREWAESVQAMDEIWAPNAFVANAFREIFSGPITVIPPCAEIDDEIVADRAAFQLDEGVFYFIFTFDYFSYPARKNPLAVLDAFLAAFPDRTTPVGLVIKSTSAPGAHEDIKLALSKAAARDGRIVIIDKTLSRSQLLSLIACGDCYVSLHRSEGFGLGMVEAMALGKPVMATDFSGSRDFLSESTGFPVGYTLKPVRETDYIFTQGQHWAEPDHASAVTAMRFIYANPAEAARRAASGRDFVLARYGSEAVAGDIETRSRAIFAQLGWPLPS